MRENDLLTAEEVMGWLKVSLVTIRRWTSSGYIPHVKLGLRMVRYRKEDIDAWLANFHRFETKCPETLALAVQALVVCQYTADFPKLERTLEGLRQERYKARDGVELCDCLEEMLYLLLYFDVEPELMQRFALTYNATAPRVYGEPLPPRANRACQRAALAQQSRLER